MGFKLIIVVMWLLINLQSFGQRVEVEQEVLRTHENARALRYDSTEGRFVQYTHLGELICTGSFEMDSMFMDTVNHRVELYGNFRWKYTPEATDEFYIGDLSTGDINALREIEPVQLTENIKVAFTYNTGESLVIANRTHSFYTTAYNISKIAGKPHCNCYHGIANGDRITPRKFAVSRTGGMSCSDSIIRKVHVRAMQGIVVYAESEMSRRVFHYVVRIKHDDEIRMFRSCGTGAYTEEIKQVFQNIAVGDEIDITEIRYHEGKSKSDFSGCDLHFTVVD